MTLWTLAFGRQTLNNTSPVKWQMSVKERDDILHKLLSLVKEFSMVLPGCPDDTGDSHRRTNHLEYHEFLPLGWLTCGLVVSQATLMQKDFYKSLVLQIVWLAALGGGTVSLPTIHGQVLSQFILFSSTTIILLSTQDTVTDCVLQ